MSQPAISNSFNIKGICHLQSCRVVGFYIWDTNQGDKNLWKTSLLLDQPDQPGDTVQERLQIIRSMSTNEETRLNTIRISLMSNENCHKLIVVPYKDPSVHGMTTAYFSQAYDVVSVRDSSRIHATHEFVSHPEGGVPLPTVEDIIASMNRFMPGYHLPKRGDNISGVLAWHILLIRNCLGIYMDANDLSSTIHYLETNFPEGLVMGEIIHLD